MLANLRAHRTDFCTIAVRQRIALLLPSDKGAEAFRPGPLRSLPGRAVAPGCLDRQARKEGWKKGDGLIALVCETFACSQTLRVLRGKTTYRFTPLRFPPFSIPLFAPGRLKSRPGCPRSRQSPGRRKRLSFS